MDLALGLMLTATALYQEAETPFGTVGFLYRDDDEETARAGGLAGAVATRRLGMRQSLQHTFEAFEATERRRDGSEQRELYTAMRKFADWFERGRFEEEEQEENQEWERT